MVPEVTRFAGYPSPDKLATDPSLNRDDKIGGLRTWRGLIVQHDFGQKEGERHARLIVEIDRALRRLDEA